MRDQGRRGLIPGDPTARQRLRYALGGRLPDAQRDWVRHDLLDAGWRGRAMLRALLQAAPVAALLALLPGPWYLHLMMPLFVLVCVVFVAAAYAEDLRDRRLRQHALPVPDREPPPRGF